jgi:hypothetical protein
MNSRLRLWLFSFGLATGLLALGGWTYAAGDPISVGDKIRFFNREGSTGGGEFGVAKLPNAATELFRTFCVQRTEFMDFHADGFNVVGLTDHSILGNKLLHPHSAFLFWAFRNGSLSGYDYTPLAQARIDSADALQIAIWSLQTEITAAQFNAYPTAIKTLATSFLGQATSAAWSDIGNVRVMNLTWATTRSGFSAGDNAQDQLVLVPTPKSLHAGIGLIGGVVLVGVIRRRAVAVPLVRR